MISKQRKVLKRLSADRGSSPGVEGMPKGLLAGSTSFEMPESRGEVAAMNVWWTHSTILAISFVSDEKVCFPNPLAS